MFKISYSKNTISNFFSLKFENSNFNHNHELDLSKEKCSRLTDSMKKKVIKIYKNDELYLTFFPHSYLIGKLKSTKIQI